jgi:hypothetical protein
MVGDPQAALTGIVEQLRSLRMGFALVGGLAVSLRGEVRFTRDVDIVVAAKNDEALEGVIHKLRRSGYEVAAIVEHQDRRRLATVRLLGPGQVVVDLIGASSGLEAEIVARALPVELAEAGAVPVARAEELLAMKVLSMGPRRLQDRIDAEGLLATNPDISLHVVRENLLLIQDRGFDRDQDLLAKLQELLA